MENTQEDTQASAETRADSARVDAGFENLDPESTKTAYEGLDNLLRGLAEQVVHTFDQMIPHLAEMQALLSQRGKARKKVLKLAGMPKWSEYAKAYAQKLDCSMRTIQDHITVLRRDGKSEPSSQSSAKRQNRPTRLDARQQSALVKAQLAANEIVLALKNGGDWKTPVAEYETVAVTPAKLDSFMSKLNPEPDWKEVLTRLVYVLEQCGDRLPLLVLNKTRETQAMLNGTTSVPASTGSQPSSPKLYAKFEKRDSNGNLCWAVIRDGDKTAWGTYAVETDADNAIESLHSPVVSLSDIGTSAKKPVVSVRLQCSGCKDMHEGIANLAEANPEWDDHQVADASGCSVTIVRQAKTRFLGWKGVAG